MDNLEVVRALPKPQVRATSDGSMPEMEVAFSTFNTWYQIDSFWEGSFMERTAPGSFKKSIKENGSNVRCLFNHGFDPSIGDKVLGPITDLAERDASPVGVVQLLDTSYNHDLVPGLDAGVYGSSMRFQVMKDEWDQKPKRSDYNPDGLPERTIKEVRLLEFGPVTFPANPASTAGLRSAGSDGSVRSLTDDYYARLMQRDPEGAPRLHESLVRFKAQRTPDGEAARGDTSESSEAAPEDTSGAAGAAEESTDEPAQPLVGLSPSDRRKSLITLMEATP